MSDVPLIGLFIEDSDGKRTPGGVFSQADFCGTLPQIGDLIVDPGVIDGYDRNEPANRRLYAVVARYFRPQTDRPSIALVVRARAGTIQEIDQLGD